jgi:2-polyprenyl-3-methyl-5-hydroxy-6-metoxy-1,4-benzoquinol methylase
LQALHLYDARPAGVRFHTRARAWTAPLDAVAAAIPRAGRILDVGCGHGLVANEIALRDPSANVLGIDYSEEKIRHARATVGERSGIEFRHQALEDVTESGFDAVCVVDVMYLVPSPAWTSFLAGCHGKLASGGTFVLKEVVTDPRWKFHRIRFQEFLSTRVLRITKGDTMHFETADSLKARLAAAGFIDVRVQRLDEGYMTPHVLLTGRKA